MEQKTQKTAVEFAVEKLELIPSNNETKGWVSVKDSLPKALETVWLTNGRGWCCLGCLVEDAEGWHWAESNGIIYIDGGKIVSECESEDLEVNFWHELPIPPIEGKRQEKEFTESDIRYAINYASDGNFTQGMEDDIIQRIKQLKTK